jgi:hypothetical protein
MKRDGGLSRFEAGVYSADCWTPDQAAGVKKPQFSCNAGKFLRFIKKNLNSA